MQVPGLLSAGALQPVGLNGQGEEAVIRSETTGVREEGYHRVVAFSEDIRSIPCGLEERK